MARKTYIADGFMADCEELIYSLTEEFSTVDFHQFCTFWKEKEYDTMFYGRQSGAEVVEFTEEALQVARLYFVTKTSNYEDQVVGLFICYTVLTIQPYKRLVPLRLIPEDVPVIEEFEAIARKNKRNDVLMTLGKLLIIGPTQFHVSVRERAMDPTIRKYYDGSIPVPEFIYRRWYGLLDKVMFKTFEEIDATEEMYALLKKMMKMKIKSHIPGTNVKIDMSTSNLGKPLLDSLKKLIASDKAEETKETEEVTMSTVKEMAMKKSVDPMKHLQGLNERKVPKRTTDSKQRNFAKTKRKGFKRFRDSSSSSEDEVVEGALKGMSLPELEFPASEERVNSPEDLFRSPNKEKSVNELKRKVVSISKPNNDKKSVKGKGKGKSTRMPKDSIEKTVTNNKSRNTMLEISNSSTGRFKRSRKKTPRNNALNKRIKLTNLDSDEYILPHLDLSDQSDDEFIEVPEVEPIEVKEIEKETEPTKLKKTQQKGKVKKINQIQINKATVQSRPVKEVLEFEIDNMPLVIRADEGTQPFEIEVIDNYQSTNDRYEEMCEISDDEGTQHTKTDSQDKSIAETTGNDDTRKANETVQVLDDDTVEVFAVYYDDDEDKNDEEVQEMVNKVLRKEVRKAPAAVVDKRKMKRTNLRSKLKKLGILPVANFKEDSK